MAKTSKDNLDNKNSITDLKANIVKLEEQFLEHWQQIRLGATNDIRKPRLLRKQIAKNLTKINALKNAKTDSKDEVKK